MNPTMKSILSRLMLLAAVPDAYTRSASGVQADAAVGTHPHAPRPAVDLDVDLYGVVAAVSHRSASIQCLPQVRR